MDGSTLVILSLLGVLLLTCILGALIYRTVQATITGFFWSREIFFEHVIWVEESSLDGFPRGSRNQHSQPERYEYHEYSFWRGRWILVRDWRTRYFYEIPKWARSRELHTEGTERATCHWPVYQLNQSTQERREKTREKYLVFFQTAKGKQLKRKLLENKWATLDEQATYTLKVNFFGHAKQFFPETQQVITAVKQIP